MSGATIFTSYGKEKNDVKHEEAGKQYYGDGHNVKGHIHQLVEGSGPFAKLYYASETRGGDRKILTSKIVGKDNKHQFEPERDFDADYLSRNTFSKDFFADGNQLTGRSVWNLFEDALCDLKKATAITMLLNGKIVQVDVNMKVVGYMSGHNEQSYFQALIDGFSYEAAKTKTSKKNPTKTTTSKKKPTKTAAAQKSSDKAALAVPVGFNSDTPIDVLEERIEQDDEAARTSDKLPASERRRILELIESLKSKAKPAAVENPPAAVEDPQVSVLFLLGCVSGCL